MDIIDIIQTNFHKKLQICRAKSIVTVVFIPHKVWLYTLLSSPELELSSFAVALPSALSNVFCFALNSVLFIFLFRFM